jgi:hypothetical protein
MEKLVVEFLCAGKSMSEVLRLPLVHQSQTIGQLLLGPRAPGEDFSSADHRLLDDLAREAGVAVHAVRLTTLRDFMRDTLGWELSEPLDAPGWLSVSSQALLEVTAGAVYHDGPGELSAVRERLAWYPQDVWLYLLACGWQRIGQEEHLMPRAGYVGDEIGSALMGARLVRDLMYLCFLMEKRYPPYPKWFGTAFHHQHCAAELEPVFQQVLWAQDWQERQSALVRACSLVVRLHNSLGITEALSEEGRPFFDRPFQVIEGGRIVAALQRRIAAPEVQAVARLGLVGSVDQFSDNTDLRAHLMWRERLRRLVTPED